MLKTIEQSKILNNPALPLEFRIADHQGGFDKNLHNDNLAYINQQAIIKNVRYKVWCEQYLTTSVTSLYPGIEFCLDLNNLYRIDFSHFVNYNIHPEIDYKNFICSFNGTDHVSRQLLTSILNHRGFFHKDYCSKNFAHNNDWITGHLPNLDLTDQEVRLYRKFFLNSDEFNDNVYSFDYTRYRHQQNIRTLEKKLTGSFLHIVSETLATSYYPHFSEKSLYSVVTRGLFLAYAQPGWHTHFEKYYGFRKYDRIFDYRFDQIQNPVKRLIELISMISKFSTLSLHDWRDLYEMEIDTIEYNYDHYFSKKYLKNLGKLC